MVGSVDRRRSMSRLLMRTLARPSCGTRRSAMFMPPMIFRREMTLLCRSRGTVSTLRMMPSMRIRTCRSPSRGSKCTSEARSVAARSMMEFTRRMVGALCASSSASSVVPAKRTSVASVPVAVELAASVRMSSMARAAPSLP